MADNTRRWAHSAARWHQKAEAFYGAVLPSLRAALFPKGEVDDCFAHMELTSSMANLPELSMLQFSEVWPGTAFSNLPGSATALAKRSISPALSPICTSSQLI